jgi:hypothetical protein
VREDIIDELVSVEAATDIYGVVLADAQEIDTAATKTARQR